MLEGMLTGSGIFCNSNKQELAPVAEYASLQVDRILFFIILTTLIRGL